MTPRYISSCKETLCSARRISWLAGCESATLEHGLLLIAPKDGH